MQDAKICVDKIEAAIEALKSQLTEDTSFQISTSVLNNDNSVVDATFSRKATVQDLALSVLKEHGSKTCVDLQKIIASQYNRDVYANVLRNALSTAKKRGLVRQGKNFRWYATGKTA